MTYISGWEIHTGSLGQSVAQAVELGKVELTDTVWVGPGGDAVIANTAADLDEEYADYSDGGLVEEYVE